MALVRATDQRSTKHRSSQLNPQPHSFDPGPRTTGDTAPGTPHAQITPSKKTDPIHIEAGVLRRKLCEELYAGWVARRGRPVAELVLTDDEFETLRRWARRAKSSQALAQRCRIVLGCAAGNTNKQVAEDLGVSPQMVCKWRQRFVDKRLDGLADEPRPGAPRRITDEAVEEVVVATLEREPRDATHWSRASMAAETGLSKSTVGRIWKAFGLKPHRVDTFKISNDPQFIDKVRDVVGLYVDPPEKALVLCVDEKSQIQALDRSAPVLPMMPGMPERRTHDYVRHGITTLFAALNVATGEITGSIHRRHRAVEFKKFLTKLDNTTPADLHVHLICDNYATHKAPAVAKWLDEHPRFHMHHTPTYSSWLNQVERWFGLLTDKQLRRGTHRSVQALEKDIRDWIKNWNEDPKPFAWTKTADEILERLASYLQRIPGAGH
jgi:transposase